MAWFWYFTLLFVWLLSQQDYVQACDAQFKQDIIVDFERILDSKLDRINGKLDEIENIKNELRNMKGLIHGMETDVSGIGGRTDASLEAMREVKEITNQLHTDVSGIGGRTDASLQATTEVKKITDQLHTEIQEMNTNCAVELKALNSKFEYFEDSLNQMKDLSNSSFEELSNKTLDLEKHIMDIVIINTNTTELLQSMADEKESMRVYIQDLIPHNTTELIFQKMKTEINNQTNEMIDVIIMASNTTELLVQNLKTEIKDHSRLIISKLEPSNKELSTKLTAIENFVEPPTTTPEPGSCNLPWVRIGSECFLINSGKASWNQARTNCKKKGGDLAQPNDLQSLRMYLQENEITKDYWIGGRREGDSWKWLSGRAMIDPWISGQPDDDESCLDFRSSKNPSLNNYGCNKSQFYICEREEESVTNPTTAQSSGCPEAEGFFRLSQGCFKIFRDQDRSYEASQHKCQTQGLMLAEPSNSEAVRLRKHLLDNYGEGDVWLGARGAGSTQVWQTSMVPVSNSNPLWVPGEPTGYTSTDFCMVLRVTKSALRDNPGRPYYARGCGGSIFVTTHALCMK